MSGGPCMMEFMTEHWLPIDVNASTSGHDLIVIHYATQCDKHPVTIFRPETRDA